MSTSRHAAEKKKKNIEIRLCVVAAGVIGLWFISWTPYATIALLGIFDLHQYITPTSSMIPALLCKAASCIDPYIYAITHPRFKRELIKMFCYNKKKDLARTMYYEQPVWRTRTSRYNNKTEAGWSYGSSDADAGHSITIAAVEQRELKRPASYYKDRYSSECESDISHYGEKRLSRYSDHSSSDHRISRSSLSSRGEYHCVNNVSKLPPKPEPKLKKVKKSRFCWKKKRKISEPMTMNYASRVVQSECEVKSVTQDISREVETA
ncbi:hypothetical protein WDU94_011733 [Cyamophila willieti]